MRSFKEYLVEKEDEKKEIEKKEEETEEEETFYKDGVYISVKMTEESSTKILEYLEKYLPDVEHNEEQHCTLIYSKKEQKEEILPEEYTALAMPKQFSKFGENLETLVVEITCDQLVNRNLQLVNEYGFISDFEEYKPHFTLAYNCKDVDILTLPPLDMAITFNEETVEQLDDNWSSNNKDEDSEEENVFADSETFVGQEMNKFLKKGKKDAKSSEKE